MTPYHPRRSVKGYPCDLGTIVRTISVPQFLIDQDHRIIAWNKALEQLTGIKEEEMIGTSQHGKAFYGVKRPCLADLLADELFGDLTLWTRTHVRSQHVLTMRRSDRFFPPYGKRGKMAACYRSPVRDSTGNVVGSVETIENLTEQKLLERALKLSEQKLQLMNGIAWHEIENKITSVRGYVELSKKSVKNENDIMCFEAEETILKQIHELLRYTMDYQKIGMQPPLWVNVAGTIRSILSLMENGSLRMDLDVDALELFGDPTLEMMFSYLIKNTVKNGKTAPEIRISFTEIPEGLRSCTEDNITVSLSRGKHQFKGNIIKAESFCMKFVHDILEYSGTGIKEDRRSRERCTVRDHSTPWGVPVHRSP